MAGGREDTVEELLTRRQVFDNENVERSLVV
jgi:hypothetical protein